MNKKIFGFIIIFVFLGLVAINFINVSYAAFPTLSTSTITSSEVSVIFTAEDKTKTTPPYTLYLVDKKNEFTDVTSNQYKVIESSQISSMGVAIIKFSGLKPSTEYNVKLEYNNTKIAETNFTTKIALIPAEIKSFSPTAGKVGSEVTIKGTNINNINEMLFNGTVAVPKTTTPDVTVLVPVGATTGKITIRTALNGNAVSVGDFVVTSGTVATPPLGGAGVVDTPSADDEISDIESSGIVPRCNVGAIDKVTGQYKTPCNFTFFIKLINRIIKFLLFVVATPLIALILIYVAYLYLTAGGKAGQVEKVRHILFNAVIGYIIALGAWLIINTIVTTLKVDPTINTFMNTIQ